MSLVYPVSLYDDVRRGTYVRLKSSPRSVFMQWGIGHCMPFGLRCLSDFTNLKLYTLCLKCPGTLYMFPWGEICFNVHVGHILYPWGERYVILTSFDL